MKKTVLALGVALLLPVTAMAQDVPGIEICTAEKTMERRTGCLQSNVDFLKGAMTKAALANQQKMDTANRQIDGLKITLVGLQKTIEQLQARIETLEKKPAAPATPAPAAK